MDALKSLCISIRADQAGGLFEALPDLLVAMGYKVMDLDQNCDATLDIRMTGEALSESYQVNNTSGNRTCFAGAKFTGEITLSAQNAIPLVQTISEVLIPPNTINENYNQVCPMTEQGAPYEKVWPIAIVRTLKQIFGDTVVIAALQVAAFKDISDVLDPAPYSETLIQGLIGLMTNPDPATSARAIELIRYLRPIPEAVIIAVADQLNTDQNNSLLWSVLVDAGFVSTAALPQIISILNSNSESEVRRYAITTIRNIGSPAKSAAPAVVVALQDSETYIRLLAAETLGEIMASPEVAVQPLINTLGDADNDVRLTAGLALSQITNQPEYSSWDATMWQKWWDTPPTPTPVITPVPEEVLILDAPDAFAEQWRLWNGKYVVYVHRSENIQNFIDLDGKYIWLSLVDTVLTVDEKHQMIDDATMLGENSGVNAELLGTGYQTDFENFIYDTNHYADDLYSIRFLGSSNIVGFMLPEVSHYYHFDQNRDLIRVEFE